MLPVTVSWGGRNTLDSDEHTVKLIMSGGGIKLPPWVLFGPEENKSVIAFNHG